MKHEMLVKIMFTLCLQMVSFSSAEVVLNETFDAKPDDVSINVPKGSDGKFIYDAIDKKLNYSVMSNNATSGVYQTEGTTQTITPPYRVTLDFMCRNSFSGSAITLWAQRQQDDRHYFVSAYFGGENDVDWYWGEGCSGKQKHRGVYDGNLKVDTWYKLVLDVTKQDKVIVMTAYILHVSTEKVIVPPFTMRLPAGKMIDNHGFAFEVSVSTPVGNNPFAVDNFKVDQPIPVAQKEINNITQEKDMNSTPNKIYSPTISLSPLKKAPIIDGTVNDDEWAGANVLDGLSMLDLQVAPRDRTRIWIGYDSKYLYMAFKCWMQPGVKPRTEVFKPGGPVFTDDCVEIFIDPNRSGTEYHFVGNSVGAPYEEKNLNGNWHSGWKYVAHHTPFGWEGEAAIPLSDFCVIPSTGDTWGLLVGRTVQNPDMQFSQWGGAETTWHNPKSYGTMIFSKDKPQICISDIQPRGIDIGLNISANNFTDKPVAIKYTAVLCSNKQKDSSAEKQAAVLIFDEQRDLMLGEENEKVLLQPAKMVQLKLPALPMESGSYYLDFCAETAEGQKILQQRIPLDRIKPMTISVRKFPSAGVMEVSVDVSASGKAKEVTSVCCELKGADGKVIWTQQGKNEFKFNQYGQLLPGSYVLYVKAKNSSNHLILKDSLKITKPLLPTWFNNSLGKEDIVMKPWTPVKISDDNAVEVWGRKYVFAQTGLPSQIFTQNNEILARPFELTGEVGGKPITLIPLKKLIIVPGATKTIIMGLSYVKNNPDLKIEVKTTVEFDGFAWVEMHFSGNGQTIDHLYLDVPLKEQFAHYYLPVFNDAVTIPDKGMFAPVIPRIDWSSQKTTGLYWVGNEDCGLAFSAEDDRNWKLLNHDKAFELIPSDGEVIWRSHLFDISTKLSAPVDIDVCWQATPAKPVKKWYNHRVVGDGWYPAPKGDKQHYNAVEAQKKGIQVAHCHEPWTEIMGYPGTFWYSDQVKEAMKDAHGHGLHYALYSQNVISSIAPEFDEWGNEFSLSVPMQAAFQRVPPQSVYFTCKGSSWSDFYIWNWVRMIKEYGVNGMYLDGTYIPAECTNPYHEHANRDSNGEIRPTMPIRAARDFMKRMLRATRAVDPSFFFLGHGQTVFTGHFMDYAMTGENFWLAKPGSEIPLDYMRAMLGRQWGTPMEFYRGPVMDYAYILPIALAHGIGVWTSGFAGETDTYHVPIWNIWDKFGIEDAEFVPYWKNSSSVKSSNPDVVASYYKKTDNVLLAVATAKRKKPTATISVNLADLGLDQTKLKVTTGGGKPIEVKPENGILKLKFPEQASLGYYVWLSNGGTDK